MRWHNGQTDGLSHWGASYHQATGAAHPILFPQGIPIPKYICRCPKLVLLFMSHEKVNIELGKANQESKLGSGNAESGFISQTADRTTVGRNCVRMTHCIQLSERASERMHERSGARERSEKCGASKWVSGASERASGGANGPVLNGSIS